MEKKAYRILIAHSGETLASQDINEILRYAWDGHFSKDVKITSNPLTKKAWDNFKVGQPGEEFAFSWLMWQQMLQRQYGEYPFWDDHKTKPYNGLITRTGQHFYIEIYYKEE